MTNRRGTCGVLAAALSCLLAGCQTPGQRLEPSLVQQFRAGQDRREVRQVLGPPNWSQGLGGGKMVDTYFYDLVVFSTSSSSPSARDWKVRSFSIRYDDAGRIEKTLLYESLTPIQFYRRQAYAGPTITSADVARIKTGATTREELEKLYGNPTVVEVTGDDFLVLHWYHEEVGTSFRQFEQERGLHVIVDLDGIVRNLSYHDTSDERK